MNAAEIAQRLNAKLVAPRHWKALCPCHNDRDPSLDITEKNGTPLVICRAGCAQGEVIEALRLRGAWPIIEKPDLRFVCAYDYRDEDGKMLFQVVRRHAPKDFPQRRPNGIGGWIWKMDGVRRVLYRLPELLAAKSKSNGHPPRVYVVEGEKDADRLAFEWGLTATTNPGGADKWRDEFNHYFAGFDVVILPDNDDGGRKHAQNVARNLAPVAASVRIPQLGGLPEKGDISDWIDDGGSQSDLETLVEITEPYGVAAPKSQEDTLDAALSGTEDEVALEFSNRHSAELRYVKVWLRWLRWEGARWRRIEDLQVFHHVRIIAREYAKLYNDKKLGKAAATAAIESLARNDRRHDTPSDAWDLDLQFFNTPEES